MSERIKFKDGEKSQLVLSNNAKEEFLLHKKLGILESMKKQAESSLTLDQRIVYNKFSIKLKRSELAHAKLLGNKELVKLLSQSLFPNLHTVVTDGREKAVKIILQNAAASRAISAPGRIQSQPRPVSAARKQHSCHGLPEGKEAEMKVAHSCLEPTEEINIQLRKQRGTSSGTKSSGPTDFHQSVHFHAYKRPHTTNDQKFDKQSARTRKSQEFLVTSPLQQTNPPTEAEVIGRTFVPEGFAKTGLKGGFLEHKRRSRNIHKRRPSSRNLFLGLYNSFSRIDSGMNNPMTRMEDDSINYKVKLFVQKVTALKQEQDCPYSERLLEKTARKCPAYHDFPLNYEMEECKWKLVDSQANQRSITIKKLDTNFGRKESLFKDSDMGMLGDTYQRKLN